jgi:hypothetical protein
MRAYGWDHVVPYQADLQVALDELRRQDHCRPTSATPSRSSRSRNHMRTSLIKVRSRPGDDINFRDRACILHTEITGQRR